LGPDPKGAIDALLKSARTRSGADGISVASVASAINTALGFPRGDRAASTNALAAALAAARDGDTSRLQGLVTEAEDLRHSDGEFVNVCSDALDRPPRTGSASSSWRGPSSIRSSVPSAHSTW